MRRLSHLTPRYVYNRVRWKLYEMAHPDEPWINRRAIELLSTLLLLTDRGLEWGSGRSTRWYARRLAHLTSVESDPVWYERVKGQIADAKVTNVEYLLRPDVEGDAASPYVRVVDAIPDQSLGFALVDGMAREACMLAVMPKMAVGGVLVLDNANWYVDHPTKSPQSRYGKGPPNDAAREFAERLRGWRMVWTTTGVNDTAIWIRPGSV